jgi:hypothetical protein
VARELSIYNLFCRGQKNNMQASETLAGREVVGTFLQLKVIGEYTPSFEKNILPQP